MNNLDPVDFFPGYDPYFCVRQNRPRYGTFTSICTHLLAMVVAIGICVIIFYQYDTDDFKSDKIAINKFQFRSKTIAQIRGEIERMKENIERTRIWRNQINELFTKIYVQQEAIIEKNIERALDIYDGDKIGLFDYASVYACGYVVSTPDTVPYPANKSISIFNLLNMDLLSNPESMLQPNNLPGNCFAFYGSSGKIRIKLGKRIPIKAVTLDHIQLMEDASSAPKEFEVYGLYDLTYLGGEFLGRFTYNLTGRPYQTFSVNRNYSDILFEYVELSILSNYGKREFTCVYRFRVHNAYPPKEKNRTSNLT